MGCGLCLDCVPYILQGDTHQFKVTGSPDYSTYMSRVCEREYRRSQVGDTVSIRSSCHHRTPGPRTRGGREYSRMDRSIGSPRGLTPLPRCCSFQLAHAAWPHGRMPLAARTPSCHCYSPFIICPTPLLDMPKVKEDCRVPTAVACKRGTVCIAPWDDPGGAGQQDGKQTAAQRRELVY